MTITAKYASICPCCAKSISPGDKVEWSKGAKARHVVCTSTASAPVYMTRTARQSTGARRPGKWTGCSCGSREDSYGDLISSARNCSSCEHDA